MKTSTVMIMCLCCVTTVLIARPTVALPIAEEDAANTTAIQTPTTEEEVIAVQTTVEPEVTSTQSAIAPEVIDTVPVNTTDEILNTTSEPAVIEVTEVTTAAQVPAKEVTTYNSTDAERVKDKLSEQIRKILKHYQQPDPVGFPDSPIPDPLSLPPMSKSLSFVEMVLDNITVHGLSKFEVDQINVDLKNMTVNVLLRIKRLYVLGNYTLKKMWGRPDSGPFNVTLLDVEAEGTAALRPDNTSGRLEATDTEVDMQFEDCVLDFANMSPLYRDTVNSFGPALFELIKPFVTDEINADLRRDVNARIRSVTGKLPALGTPLPDLAVAEAREYVRRMGYDPYRIPDRQVRGGPLDVTVANVTVTGLSDFRRVGDIGLEVRGTVLQMTVHVVTGRINGTADWRFRLGVFGRGGQANVTADHVQVRAVVNQTLDVRRQPVLDKLDIEVGRVTVQSDRREPVDFMVETALNSLPDLVRHIIVDALEEPIKFKVQTVLDEVQVDKLIEDRLPDLDRLMGDA